MAEENEKKKRIPIWLYPSTIEKMDELYEDDNCKSRSEYIEKAVQFYNGYIISGNLNHYLPVSITSALAGMLEGTENRLARIMFKQAVELSMLMNLYAAQNEVEEAVLYKLRGKCVSDVKKTGGSVSLDEVVQYQNGKE